MRERRPEKCQNRASCGGRNNEKSIFGSIARASYVTQLRFFRNHFRLTVVRTITKLIAAGILRSQQREYSLRHWTARTVRLLNRTKQQQRMIVSPSEWTKIYFPNHFSDEMGNTAAPSKTIVGQAAPKYCTKLTVHEPSRSSRMLRLRCSQGTPSRC